MKNIFILLFFCFNLIFTSVYAYTLTNNDYTLADKVTSKIESLIKKKGEDYRDRYVKELVKLGIKYKDNGRMYALIAEVITSLKNESSSLEKMLLEGDKSTNSSFSQEKDKVEISDLTSGVTNLTCWNNKADQSSGSAFLMKVKGKYSLYTNFHVIDGMDKCLVMLKGGVYEFSTAKLYVFNDFSDFGFFYFKDSVLLLPKGIRLDMGYDGSEGLIDVENSKISNLALCPNDMKIGTKTYVLGYPKFGFDFSNINTGSGKVNAQTKDFIMTEGSISGMYNQIDESSLTNKNLYPNDNYYVSNKMDSGNSGGPAIAEYKDELCLLGIATWVKTGNFDNQGIIQNINNIHYSEK